MLSEKMQQALNAQINAEYYSSYLYLAMAAYCEEVNLKGFRHWFQIQSREELGHALKFFQYVLDRKGKVLLSSIDGPPTQWPSPLAVFEATLEHEQHVTKLINDLVGLARGENDNATFSLLQWFINEQVEEEAAADAIMQQLKLAEGAPAALFLLDRELGARTATGGGPAGGEAV